MFTPRDFIKGPVYVLRGKRTVKIRRPTKEWDGCAANSLAKTVSALYCVSTVFLGSDHRRLYSQCGGTIEIIGGFKKIILPPSDGPILFETAVFNNPGCQAFEIYGWCNYSEAIKGHKEVVKKYA